MNEIALILQLEKWKIFQAKIGDLTRFSRYKIIENQLAV